MSKNGHCEEQLRQFSDYLDGDLAPELCAQLEAHLQSCENCRIVLNTLKKTIDLYHMQGGDDALPEQVRSRLFARLRLDVSNGEKPSE